MCPRYIERQNCTYCPLRDVEGVCPVTRGNRCWLLEWIAPPAMITTIHALVYLLQVGLGVYVVRSGAELSVAAVGPLLTAWWGWMCIAGGAFGFLGCVPGVWWLEKIGLALVWAASVIQVVILTQAGWAPGHLTALLGFMALMVVRWLRIRSAALDPARRPGFLKRRARRLKRGA